MSDPIYINLAQLAGVDDATFAKADSGDRQAQKVMMRNLLTQKASAAALTTMDWMHWTLRGIATGSEEAIGDALGSIAEAGRNRRLTAKRTDALNKMYEQHFGPGEVGSTWSTDVLAAFAGDRRAVAVIRLFLLADKLAGGITPVGPADIAEGVKTAEAIKADGATAFFTAVQAQHLASEAPARALDVAMKAIRIFADLAKDDAAYTVKLGQTVYLASQITEIAGQPQAGMLLRAAYSDAVEAFVASQQE